MAPSVVFPSSRAGSRHRPRRRRNSPADGSSPVAAAPTQGPARAAAGKYTNPVIWQDYADIDVIRVGNT